MHRDANVVRDLGVLEPVGIGVELRLLGRVGSEHLRSDRYAHRHDSDHHRQPPARIGRTPQRAQGHRRRERQRAEYEDRQHRRRRSVVAEYELLDEVVQPGAERDVRDPDVVTLARLVDGQRHQRRAHRDHAAGSDQDLPAQLWQQHDQRDRLRCDREHGEVVRQHRKRRRHRPPSDHPCLPAPQRLREEPEGDSAQQDQQHIGARLLRVPDHRGTRRHDWFVTPRTTLDWTTPVRR